MRRVYVKWMQTPMLGQSLSLHQSFPVHFPTSESLPEISNIAVPLAMLFLFLSVTERVGSDGGLASYRDV
jgi:hypothetical protein